MSTHDVATQTAEQRRIATQQYERARQAIAAGNPDYAIELLCTCCKLDPANLIYRRMLRQTQKAKFHNNLRGSLFAFLTTAPAKAHLRVALQARHYFKALECGEDVLSRNPWDTGTQLAMATAADRAGLTEVAAFILEQARQKNPKNRYVNRPLALLYEKLGNFNQAIVMWDLVYKANPKDFEASRKGKDLAATHTITRGHYEEAALGVEAPQYRDEIEEKASEVPLSATESRLARQVQPIRAKIAADPANPNHYLQLVRIYREAQLHEEARHVLDEALVPTGQHFDIQIELAELEIEPFRQNLRISDEKLRANPEDEELQRIRVRLLKEINTREMDLFRQKADRFPTEAGPRLELGIRLLRAGQNEEAIRELQVARKDPRLRWRALLYLGHCFKSKSNWALARRNFEEALQTLPPEEDTTRKELLYQLACGAAEEHDWQAALDVGNDLANVDFTYRDIGKLLDEWQEKLKQHHALE